MRIWGSKFSKFSSYDDDPLKILMNDSCHYTQSTTEIIIRAVQREKICLTHKKKKDYETCLQPYDGRIAHDVFLKTRYSCVYTNLQTTKNNDILLAWEALASPRFNIVFDSWGFFYIIFFFSSNSIHVITLITLVYKLNRNIYNNTWLGNHMVPFINSIAITI